MQRPVLHLFLTDLFWLLCLIGLIWLPLSRVRLIWWRLIWQRLVWLRMIWGLGLIWRLMMWTMLTWRLHETRAEVLYRALRPLLHRRGPRKDFELHYRNNSVKAITESLPC